MASLKEIAAELGVSPSTVSRALRNDPSISEAMRARVAESAERRGYRPDRGISSAMRRVRSGEARIEDSIAVWWPGEWDRRELRARYPHLEPTLASIGRTAESLHLACEWRDGLSADPVRAWRALAYRGVRGMILLPGDPEVYEVPAVFHDTPRVALGNAVQGAVGCRVTPHFTDAYATIFEELHARGYRRPGVLVRHHAREERLYEARYLGVYQQHCERLGRFEWIAPHWCGDLREASTYAAIRDWLGESRPDALISPYHQIYESLLADGAWPIPRRIGYVTTGAWGANKEITGPWTDPARMGSETVLALLNRMRDPLPGDAPETRILLKTEWREGATLPRRRRGA